MIVFNAQANMAVISRRNNNNNEHDDMIITIITTTTMITKIIATQGLRWVSPSWSPT